MYPSGLAGSRLHAEANVCRFARPGDKLIVMRFLANGELTMAKPCDHCEDIIREAGIRRVKYTDWNGDWQTMRL